MARSLQFHRASRLGRLIVLVGFLSCSSFFLLSAPSGWAGWTAAAVINRPQGGFPYIYAVPGDSLASHPVQEHLTRVDRPPEEQQQQDEEDYDENEEDDRPDFLYSPEAGYRMVEWYVCYVECTNACMHSGGVQHPAASRNDCACDNRCCCKPKQKLVVDRMRFHHQMGDQSIATYFCTIETHFFCYLPF